MSVLIIKMSIVKTARFTFEEDLKYKKYFGSKFKR